MTTWNARSCPAGRSPARRTSTPSWRAWLALVNTRPRRALGCSPAERITADKAAMLTLPPVAPQTGWRAQTRLARDHYVRLDSNDYSVHPAVIGRRIEVTADLARVRVLCDGQVVADHERSWAWHQSISDPAHLAAARAMRRDRVTALRRPPSRRCRSGRWPTTTPRPGWTGAWRDGRQDRRPGHHRRDRVPDPGAEGPDAARVGAPAGRAGPGRVLDPRGVPRRLPAARGRRPRVPRRRRPDPRRPVPGPQVAGGVRLRPRPRPANATSSRTWAPSTSPPPRRTWCSSARPAPARPTWPSGWPSAPARPGTGSLFATAAEWVARLADAHHAGRLQAELIRLGRYPLLVIDEVGYIPFEPEAANLFFQLVSARYERASLIVTSNKPFGRWGEVFGDDVVAAAMIDRLVHHAEVIALKGDSYRLKDRDLGRVPAAPATDD